MYRILYVDDERGLLEIAKRFLEKTNDFNVDVEISAQDALKSIDTQVYHAIISDYQMPGMDGIAFLKAVRRKHGNIPFILFTGRGREEVVIEAINNGVDFYLQKGGDPMAQFAELAHKIRQAIARHQAEISLIESEKRLADIINFLPDATFAIDRSGQVIAWNRAIEEMTGIPSADMLGKGDYEYAIPFYGSRRPILIDLIFESDAIIAKNYAHIVHEKDQLIADTTLPRLQGRIVTLMGKASPLYDRQGEIIGAIESIRDITALKMVEEELRAANEQLSASQEELHSQFAALIQSEQQIRESEGKFRDLAELLPQMVFEMDLNFRVIYANRNVLKSIGLTEDDISNGISALSYIDPSDYERVRENARRVVLGEPIENREYTAVRKDGTTFPVLIYTSPLYRKGKIDGFRGVIIDFTDRKRVESELRCAYEQITATEEELRGKYEELAGTQAELQKRQQQLEEITSTVPGVVYQFYARPDGSMGLHFVSDRSREVLGISNDASDFFEQFTRHIDPRDRDAFINSVNEAVGLRSLWNFEGRFIKPSGETIWIQGISQPFIRETEVVFSGTLLDITGRKLAEEKLYENEKKYRALVETTGTGFVITDDQGRVMDANPEYVRLTGHANLGEILGRSVTEWTAPYEKEKNLEAVRQCLKEGFIRNLEIDYEYASGTIIPIEINGTVLQSGDTVQILTLCRDISTRRSTQEALQESEAKYRTVIEQSQDGIFIAQNGYLVFHNPAFTTLTGYRNAELEGRSIADLIAPEDRELVITRHQKRLQGQVLPDVYEFSVLHHDGVRRIRVKMNITSATIDGRPATLGTLHNVMEERKREVALRESEERFRRLISRSFDAVVVHQEGRIVLANDEAVRVSGVNSTDDLVGRPILDLVHPEYRAKVAERVCLMLQSPKGTVPLIEEKFVSSDGTAVDVEVMATATVHEGRPAVMVLFRDITRRKQVEEALLKSESHLRLVSENMVDLITQIDKDRKVIYVSPSLERLTGYAPVDLNGHMVTEYIHPDDRERVIRVTLEAIESHKPSVRLEYRYRERNGEYRWFESETRILRDQNEKFSGAIFTSRDITERRQIEEDLQEKIEELDQYFTTSLDLFCIADTDGFFRRLNPEWEKALGYPLDELEGHRFLDFVHPDDLPATLATIAELAGQNRVLNFTNRYRHKDGTYRWIEWRSFPKGSRIYAAARDITERRNMENAIREANRKLNLLNSVTRHDVVNQLTILQGYTEIAVTKNTDPVIADFLARIEASSLAISRQIEFTRTYQELGIHSPAWFMLDQIVAKEGNVVVTFSDTCKKAEIYADPMLERVFFNLLDNAVRHGERVTGVTFRCRQDQDGLVIIFEDNGVGIPENEKEKIFMRGYGKNTGFGLFLAREILAITGITIRETGIPGEGARFEITVPNGGYRFNGT